MEFNSQSNKVEENMLDVDNFGKWVAKRNVKVENFLWRHLRTSDFGYPRYYETIVLERKGALSLRNVALTEQCLIVMDHPPKKFIMAIRLCDIQDISLVADRKILIKGGNNNSYICQHVQILYKGKNETGDLLNLNLSLQNSRSRSEARIKSNPKIVLQSNSNTEGYFSGENGYKLFNKYLTSNPSSTNTATPTYYSSSDRSTSRSTSEQELTFSEVSRQSSSMDESYIPMSIFYSYEPIVTAHNSELPKSNSASPLSPLYVDSTSDESDQNLSTSYGSLKPYKNKKRECKISNNKHPPNRTKSSMDGYLRDVSPINGSRSVYSDLESKEESPHQRVLKKSTNKSKSIEFEYKRNKGLVPRGIVDSSDGDGAKFMMEQRPSWTKKEDQMSKATTGIGESKKKDVQDRTKIRRPRSVDISQLSNLRKTIFGRVFGIGNKSKEDSSSLNSTFSKVTNKGSTPHLFQRNKDDNDILSDSGNIKGPTELADDGSDTLTLNLYIYQPSSHLLNELFLFWNRKFLVSNDSVPTRDWIGDMEKDKERGLSLHEAEKVFIRLSQVWSPFDESMWVDSSHPPSFTVILHKLNSLHKALMKYEHLKRLCWKNWNIIINLLGILHRSSTRQDLIAEDDEEDEDYFLDKVSVITVVVDIFRLLYEACGISWFASTNYANNNNNDEGFDCGERYRNASRVNGRSEGIPTNIFHLTQFLVRTILKCSMIPHAGISERENIIEIVLNPHKFANGRWIYYPDSKAIKLITMAHNASVALLHEILSIIHFSTKDKERAKFMSYLQNCSMEAYFKLSVTQVINLLWSNGRPAGSSQVLLLYRHVSVLKTLIDNIPSLKSFVRDTFCEEFRYFVHERSIHRRVPDRYPLKPKLLLTCEELRQEIIGKSRT